MIWHDVLKNYEKEKREEEAKKNRDLGIRNREIAQKKHPVFSFMYYDRNIRLSFFQAEVLCLLIKKKSRREMCEKIGISYTAVCDRLASIRKKMYITKTKDILYDFPEKGVRRLIEYYEKWGDAK